MRPVPTVLVGLLDDAAVFPPGNAPLADAVAAHRDHRAAPYADLVGPLLVRPEDVPAVPADLEIGVVGPCDAVAKAVDRALTKAVDRAVTRAVTKAVDTAGGRPIRQVEVPVAKRGEDPQPGLRELLSLAERTGLRAYAEIPLAWGLTAALDTIADARAAGLPVAPKFRTGGLAAELFPTPVELAAVICACRDRGLPFKLTAGLHHARRHTDSETGFTHHGFLNVLAAALAAADGAEAAEVATLLAATDATALAAAVGDHLEQDRPLWLGFGTCSIAEPVADLRQLGLLPKTGEALT